MVLFLFVGLSSPRHGTVSVVHISPVLLQTSTIGRGKKEKKTLIVDDINKNIFVLSFDFNYLFCYGLDHRLGSRADPPHAFVLSWMCFRSECTVSVHTSTMLVFQLLYVLHVVCKVLCGTLRGIFPMCTSLIFALRRWSLLHFAARPRPFSQYFIGVGLRMERTLSLIKNDECCREERSADPSLCYIPLLLYNLRIIS